MKANLPVSKCFFLANRGESTSLVGTGNLRKLPHSRSERNVFAAVEAEVADEKVLHVNEWISYSFV